MLWNNVIDASSKRPFFYDFIILVYESQRDTFEVRNQWQTYTLVHIYKRGIQYGVSGTFDISKEACKWWISE